MVSKGGLRREERERRARIQNGIVTVGTTVIGLLLFVLPRTGVSVAADLSVAWAFSLFCVWHCWGWYSTWRKRLGFLLLHTSLVIFLGSLVWPRIVVSPSVVKFQGFPNETFNFSVRNGRSDDIYDVQIPFLIGLGKNFENKLSAIVMPNTEDPHQPTTNDYNYCFGTGSGDVTKIMPNEREVLVVNLRHLPPYGHESFSVTYTGGEKFEAKSEEPSFASEPFSYSPNQGTVGVRGDYRICKYAMHSDLLEK